MAVDFGAYIADACQYLWTFNLDMGDDLYDTVHYLADEANYTYDPYLDETEEGYESEEDALHNILMALVYDNSKVIPDNLWYLFTEDALLEDIFDEIEYDQENGRTDMLDALDCVYRYIEYFPGGSRVKEALVDNVLSKL